MFIMDSRIIIEYEWPYLLTFLPPEEELERTAKESGALVRRRGVSSAKTLLRLAMAYGFCGLTLRQTAAWAKVANVADISDVALLKRLKKADSWLGMLLAIKLAERAPPPPSKGNLRVCLIDATTINRPGSKGTNWRVHLCFNLDSLAIEHVELTDGRGGETFKRFTLRPGEIAIGDRGYAHRAGLHSLVTTGADFLVRLNWQNLPLQTPDGKSFDIMDFLRKLPDAEARGTMVRVAPTKELSPIPARLVAVRKSEAAAEASRAKVMRERARKCRNIDPRTLESAGYVFVLTRCYTMYCLTLRSLTSIVSAGRWN
ncbi:MAG: transposase [Deltaproteobacteria bacterium]|nr:transposase [Deltaproteobacteria bacterium]